MTIQRLPIQRDTTGPTAGVVTLTLMQPDRPVVVLDHALLRSINAALDEIGNDPAGFVLASSSRVFIAGADLKEITSLSDAELDEYLAFGQHVYGRIAALPCASVAAINGAVLGGGLEIAMHCDALIAAEPLPKNPGESPKPYPIGLPEAGLSICPGWGGTNLLPARMDPARAIEMTATGRTFSIFEAREAGLISELVAPDQLLARARSLASAPRAAARTTPINITDPDRAPSVRAALKAARTALPDTQAVRAVVECVEAGLSRGWQAALDAERRNLITLRNTDEGRAAINAFFEKSAAR